MATEENAHSNIYNVLVYNPTNDARVIQDALAIHNNLPLFQYVATYTHEFADFTVQLHQQTWHLCVIYCSDHATLSSFRAQINAGMILPSLILFDPEKITPETLVTLPDSDYLTLPTTSTLVRHRIHRALHPTPQPTSDHNQRLAQELEVSFRDYHTRTQSILNTMSEVVVILDEDGRYIDVITRRNPLLVAPATELVGKRLIDIASPQLAKEMLQVIRKTLQTRKSQYYEHRFVINDNEKWFRANVTPFNENQVLWVATDITDVKDTRSALSEASQRYETLFRFANDAIFMIEMSTANILEVNYQASRLLGYTTDELRGMTMGQVEAPSDELSTNTDFDISVQSNSQMILEQFYRHKNGEIIPVETSNRIIKQDDDNDIIICFARDIRERKQALRAEREQRLLAETLRDTATAISRTLDRDALMDLIIDNAYKLLHKRPINMMLIDGQLAYIVRHRGYEPYTPIEKIHDMRFDIERAISIKKMLTYKRPSSINDTDKEPEWLQVKGMEWIRSQMSIPIIIQNQVVAIINADSPNRDGFSPQDRDRIHALAEQASIALQNAYLFEHIQKQTQDLEVAITNRTRALSEANVALKRQIVERARVEEQLEQVLNSARCLLWSASIRETEDGRYEWDFTVVNEDAAQKLLPLDTTEKNYSEAWGESILPEDNQRRFHVIRTHLRFSKYSIKQELRCRNAEGELVWLIEDILIKPLHEKEWYLAGVCTDITDIKTAEKSLQQANIELEKRVHQRTEELTNMNRVLSEEIIERKKAEESERQQRLLAEALRDSGAMLIDSLDDDSVLDYLLDTIADVIPHDVAHIGIFEGDHMTITKQRGYKPPLRLHPIDISEWRDMQQIIKGRTYYIIPDREMFTDWAGVPGDEWIKSNLSIPIILDEQVIGILKLESRHKNHFTQKQAEWLQAFANQAGIALRNARLVEKIRSYTEELEVRVIDRTAELANERAQLQAILDSMRDGVLYQDNARQLQYTNSALTTLTGYTSEEWRDHSAFDQINTSSPEEYNEYMNAVQHHLNATGFWRGETSLCHKEGYMIDASITRTVVYNTNHEPLGVVTVVRDISQEKALSAQKARFIASASHELRTPIANLKTRLFLMNRAPEKFTEHITIANDVVNWMQRLVEDMFDLSRFERGVIELEFETVNLQKFINDILIFQQPEAERKLIRLLTEMPAEPAHFILDPYRMTQVITNLVTNALHYTPEQGEVKVELDVNDNGSITISVIDDGDGIEPEHIPHLFEAFYRANLNRKGAGLGLSISKEIVESHGGTMSVTSQIGKGSQFTVHLPYNKHLKSDETTTSANN